MNTLLFSWMIIFLMFFISINFYLKYLFEFFFVVNLIGVLLNNYLSQIFLFFLILLNLILLKFLATVKIIISLL